MTQSVKEKDDFFQDHRYHQRLQAYWEGLRAGRKFPMESELNLDDLGDIWDSCFLISIDDVTRRLGYSYSYLGRDLLEAYGNDPTNDGTATHLVSVTHNALCAKLDEVKSKGEPVTDESEFVNLRHINIRYRICILPLGTADGTVTHMLGCMRWKMY